METINGVEKFGPWSDDGSTASTDRAVSAGSMIAGGTAVATVDMLDSEATVQAGESTFAGQVGQTINIAEVVSADYHVDITKLAESGSVGEIWISTRATNAFVVKNSGSDNSSAFAWRISGAALA